MKTVAYFGGNGHATERLAPVYRVHEQQVSAGQLSPFRTIEAPYPGFEGRPRAKTLEAFLDVIMAGLSPRPNLLLGTGIGGLLALCLRSRGQLTEQPLILHAPVLWGLEKRFMPRLMRLAPLRSLLHPLFAASWYQRRFIKKQFIAPVADDMRHAFFDGYARCQAFPDLFEWLTPQLLRVLEKRFAQRPAALSNITVWWGDQDKVVSTEELRITEEKLGVSFRLQRFDSWGHYPMIENPEEWVGALAHALEDAA